MAPHTIYFHREARDEAERLLSGEAHLAAALSRALAQELGRTPGSRIKSLRHLGTHTERRFRSGKVRSVFSLVSAGEDSRQLVFVHAVTPRDEAYSRDGFHARIERFHADVWNHESRAPRGDLSRLAYHEVTYAPSRGAPAEDEAIEPYLTARQYQYFRHLLPLTSDGAGGDPFLIIGHGPPGSGKTLVVQEVALRAHEEGNDVLILVPSTRLFGEYEGVFSAYGVKPAPLRSVRPADPQMYLYDIRELFSQLAGAAAGHQRVGERREQVWRWWQNCLGDVGLRDRVRRQAGGAQPPPAWHRRFADLLDAVYSDDEWCRDAVDAVPDVRTSTKDDVDERNETSYALLRELRAAPGWKTILSERRDRGLVLRCELAARSAGRLGELDLGDRPLLVLVDECQDLAPAEWRTLLAWCFARRRRVIPGDDRHQTRIAFVGDLNQRVSVTPFNWATLKRYAHDRLGVPRDMIVDREIETTSLRFARQIGIAASAIFDERVTRRGKNRAAPTADPEQLRGDGRVTVVVAEQAWTDVLDAADRLTTEGTTGEHLCLVCGDEQAARKADDEREHRLVFSPRTVKGLEFPAVVVVHPFEHGGASLGEALTYEQATTLYTAVTRAQERLLCVLNEREWRCLAKAADQWARAGVEAPLVAAPNVGAVLRELLPQFAQFLSDEDLLRVGCQRLADLAAGPDGDEDVWIDDIARAAGRLVRLGGLEEIVRHGAVIALEWESAAAALWARAQQEKGRNVQVAVGCLVLLGEFAAARHVAESSAADAEPSCDLEALALLELYSDWQPMIYEERNRRGDQSSPSHELVRRAFSDALLRRIKAAAVAPNLTA